MRIFIVLLLIGFSLLNLKVCASDYYWIGDSGDWSDINHWVTSSGGTTNHIQTPTSNDNVIFDANSFSTNSVVNLNSGTIFSKNFNAEQLNQNVTMSGTCSLWKVYGNFKLSKKLNFGNMDIYFEAPTGIQDIKFNNLIVSNNLYFKGNATWKLLDSLNCGVINLESGILNSNSQVITAHHFTSYSTTNRQLIISNSNVKVNSWQVNGAGYSVDATNSVIVLTGIKFSHTTGSNFTYNDVYLEKYCAVSNSPDNLTFRKLTFYKDGFIDGSNTYDSLVFTMGYEYKMKTGSNQTIVKDLVAIGDCKRPIKIYSLNSFASFTKTSGTVYCTYIILKHIHATGGAIFEAAAAEDLGDNTGWILTPPPARTLYWVGDDGDWTDTIHWSYSSGGPGGECIPTIVDDVIVDNNSFTTPSTITINEYSYCHDFTWLLNVISTFNVTRPFHLSGSLFFGDSMDINQGAFINFISDDIGETITTSNIDLNKAKMLFNGLGSWTLQDSINNFGGNLELIKGHVLTDGNYIIVTYFGATNNASKKLSLSTSTIDVEKIVKLEQGNLNIYPGTSHIRMIGANSVFETLGTNPDSLYNLSFVSDTSSATSTIERSTFNKVSHLCNVDLIGSSTSDTMYFKAGNSFTFYGRFDSIKKALIAKGSCTKIITFKEVTAMGEFNFYMPPSAIVDVSHISLRGAVGWGGANFNAINSSDLNNNSGWTFTNTSVDHFWVGGAGNWQDSTHWSYNTGGIGGACIPKIFDNVYFDGNSFISTNDTVRVDTNNIFCKDMDWNGALNNPSFYFDTSEYVHFISGSMTLIGDMDFKNFNKTFFVEDQLNKTINMAGQSFDNTIIFSDSGQWTLLDTLYSKIINHHTGSLITNQKPVYATAYYGDMNEVKLLDINNNTFHIIEGNEKFFGWLKTDHTNIITNNSEIIFDKGGILKTEGNGQVVFHNVSFLDPEYSGKIMHDNFITNKFNKLLFIGKGIIEGNNYMDTLIFSPGSEYEIQGGSSQYITNNWQANADCYGFIKVSSSSANANMHMLNGNVNLSGVKLKNINGIGSGTFNIVNGLDLGGNSSNWQISSYPARTLYWVNHEGSWWDTAHWSLNTGGLSGECIPTYIDDVIFDDSSFTSTSNTVTSLIDPIECHNMHWYYTPETPIMDIQYLHIYGSLWLEDTMLIHNTTELSLFAEDAGNVIKSASNSFYITRIETQGEWTLLDTFSSIIINHNEGTFISGGNTINTARYSSLGNLSNPPLRKLDITNSVINVENTVEIHTDNYNLVATNSDIIFDITGITPSFNLHFEGINALHFSRVTFKPSMSGLSTITNMSSSIHNFEKMTINNSADIYGEHRYDSLIFHAGNTYQLEVGKTQFINNYWFVRGNNCFALNLQSTVKGQQAYTSKLFGNVNGDFINMRDIHTVGIAGFFAGAFSTDISNNLGWTFTNGPQYVYGLGPDVSLNLGSSIVLSSVNFNGGPNTTYLWSTGSTDPNINVAQTGWYYITVNYAGSCIVHDSIFVGCNLDMNYDITHNPCFADSLGEILPIVPDTNYSYAYQWSNNTNYSAVDDLAAGFYTVTINADSGLCVLIDTLEITQPPEVFCDQSDTAFCIGDSVLLDLGNFVSYVWNDGYTDEYRWVAQRDSFIVSVKDSDGCWSFPDTINIRQDLPPTIILGGDTTICIGGYVTLDAGAGYDTYLWSNNSAMSNITTFNTGVYWVIVSEKTCQSSDTVNIYNCPPKFIVPNVFTPNGDGYNDKFEIVYQNIWEFEIRIFNRWGTRVYHSSNLESQWDGQINNQEATEGVYFWEITYKEYNGQGGGSEDKRVKGTVSLYRN